MEIGKWIKASKSGAAGACVEVKKLDYGLIAVRDSKDPYGATLFFSLDEWNAFLDGATKGEFDL